MDHYKGTKMNIEDKDENTSRAKGTMSFVGVSGGKTPGISELKYGANKAGAPYTHPLSLMTQMRG